MGIGRKVVNQTIWQQQRVPVKRRLDVSELSGGNEVPVYSEQTDHHDHRCLNALFSEETQVVTRLSKVLSKYSTLSKALRDLGLGVPRQLRPLPASKPICNWRYVAGRHRRLLTGER